RVDGGLADALLASGRKGSHEDYPERAHPAEARIAVSDRHFIPPSVLVGVRFGRGFSFLAAIIGPCPGAVRGVGASQRTPQPMHVRVWPTFIYDRTPLPKETPRR